MNMEEASRPGEAVSNRSRGSSRTIVLKRFIGLVGALAIVLAATPGLVFANAAAPHQPGHPAGEPFTPLAGVAIQREDLTFDLRPIDTRPFDPNAFAVVTATYFLSNPGPPVSTDLVFVAPRIRQGTVTFNGQPLAATAEASGSFPAEWQLPEELPSIGNGPQPYETRQDRPGGLRFHVTIPTGEHQLMVRYEVEPASYRDEHHYQYMVGYVLAPARNWGSFGQLNLRIEIPSGWDAVTTLPTQREGDTLTATFDSLPADTLGITIRPPESVAPTIVAYALWFLGVVLAPLWLGRRQAKRAHRGLATANGCLVAVGMAGLGMVTSVVAMIVWAQSLSANHTSATMVYTWLLLGPLITLIGAVVSPASWFIARQVPVRGQIER